MSYPEPIPVLRGRDALAFEEKLQNFTLTDEQKEFYREARRRFPSEETLRKEREFYRKKLVEEVLPAIYSHDLNERVDRLLTRLRVHDQSLRLSLDILRRLAHRIEGSREKRV